ncbi:MAG: 4Fe-4S dicluster domain-containing protein [Coriobacteriales bacterium]|jgi:anaerobic dimethyl sulfoxide reductase subunit B (iron-sulfur subunit)|nr:4Fe-4S dicluster domain-containing protein [Coriobacteriales bacterium]
MKNLGFYYNQSACSGCRTCQIACNDRNRLEPGTLFRKVSSYETGSYPNASIYHYSATCNHCKTPACIANCPTGALRKSPDDGTTQRDDELCIGCGTCVKTCPYGVPALLPTGKAGSCDACKPFRDAGKKPVCVDACLMRCLDFGDLDELATRYGTTSENGELLSELPLLPSSEETGPHTLINPKKAALEADFREVML